MPRKAYLETYGCQMNVNDSHVLAGRMKAEGYELVPNAEDADVIFVNTCAVRENAEERVFGRLGELKRMKMTRQGVRLGVTGCMAQRLGGEILERAGHVDFVLGTGAYGRVFEMMAARVDGGRRRGRCRGGAREFWAVFVDAAGRCFGPRQQTGDTGQGDDAREPANGAARARAGRAGRAPRRGAATESVETRKREKRDLGGTHRPGTSAEGALPHRACGLFRTGVWRAGRAAIGRCRGRRRR